MSPFAHLLDQFHHHHHRHHHHVLSSSSSQCIPRQQAAQLEGDEHCTAQHSSHSSTHSRRIRNRNRRGSSGGRTGERGAPLSQPSSQPQRTEGWRSFLLIFISVLRFSFSYLVMTGIRVFFSTFFFPPRLAEFHHTIPFISIHQHQARTTPPPPPPLPTVTRRRRAPLCESDDTAWHRAPAAASIVESTTCAALRLRLCHNGPTYRPTHPPRPLARSSPRPSIEPAFGSRHGLPTYHHHPRQASVVATTRHS
ncbi:hypothetical protein IWZ01DRAFT_104517 [Phyllosticta capitalensis]